MAETFVALAPPPESLALVLERIAAGMTKALADARLDDRIPKDTLQAMGTLWQEGLLYASEAASMERRPPSRHA